MDSRNIIPALFIAKPFLLTSLVFFLASLLSYVAHGDALAGEINGNFLPPELLASSLDMFFTRGLCKIHP